MKIRSFEEKDKSAIERICRETVISKSLQKHLDCVTLLYADFYIETEPEHIFVAVDDNDECKGYILCAPSADRFEKNWKNGYFERLKKLNRSFVCVQKSTIKKYKKLAKKGFPAHLHIDLDPDVQRCGTGTKLVDELLMHLEKIGVGGLCLDCAPSNVKGNNFYKKYGFTLYKASLFGNIYTIKVPK